MQPEEGVSVPDQQQLAEWALDGHVEKLGADVRTHELLPASERVGERPHGLGVRVENDRVIRLDQLENPLARP